MSAENVESTRLSNFNPRMAAEANVTGRKPDGSKWITAGNYPVIARFQEEVNRSGRPTKKTA